MGGVNISLGISLERPVATQSRGEFADALDKAGNKGDPHGAPDEIQPGHANPTGGNPPGNPTGHPGDVDPLHGGPDHGGPPDGATTGLGDKGPIGVHTTIDPPGGNPGGIDPGGFNPANPAMTGFNPAGTASAQITAEVTSSWNAAAATAMLQGPAAPPLSPDSHSQHRHEVTLSVTIRSNGSVTAELTGSEYRAPSAPMPPVRFATGDPIASLARNPSGPPSGTLLLPAALSVAQQPGMSLALGIEDGGALRLAAEPMPGRGVPPQAMLAAFAAGTGPISATALTAATDPWALLFTAFGSALGIGGSNAGGAATLAGNGATQDGNALIANALGGNSVSGGVARDADGAIATATLPSDGQDALARLVMLGKIAADALPLLHQTLMSSGRMDQALLWRDSPAASAAARALVAELEAEIPLYALLGYQPMSEAQAKRLRLDGQVLLPRLLGQVAQLEAMLNESPVLPPGRILRRAIADNGPMLRQAKALPIGTVFQELAIISANLFPELGERDGGFLSKKLSSEIILSRGVRGLAMGDGTMILAPETRFLLAGRLRKPEAGTHLILFAFGAEDRPFLRPEWRH